MSEGTRECEFCRDRLEEFTQDGIVCGACEGTRVLGIRDCFCSAWNKYECACDCNWEED